MPITVVQAAPTVRAAGASATVTLGAGTGAGNSLVACVTADQLTTNPGISGVTLGGVADHWQAAASNAGGSRFTAAVWYDPGCAAGQTSVAVSLTGGSGPGEELYVAVYEVSGVLVSDQASTGNAASGATTWSSGATAATTNANEIFFGACTASSAVPAVTGAGTWTTQNTGAGTFDQIAGFQIVSSTGTATFSGTIPSGGYTAVVATFAQVLTFTIGALTAAAAPSGTLTAGTQSAGGPS
jgi:hypothetical protein